MNAVATLATCAGLLLVAWIWRPRTPRTAGAVLLLGAFAALGGWELWATQFAHSAEPQSFQMWKATVFYWTVAAVVLVTPKLTSGYPAKILIGDYFALSNREWRWINRGIGLLYLVLGTASILLGYHSSYGDWVGLKYALQMNLLVVVLFRLNFVWLPLLADICIHGYRGGTAGVARVRRWLS